MMKVTNISYGHHYLIHVFYKDLTSQDIHAYSNKHLNEKINSLYNDPRVYDYYVYVGIDFDLKDDPFGDLPTEREVK